MTDHLRAKWSWWDRILGWAAGAALMLTILGVGFATAWGFSDSGRYLKPVAVHIAKDPADGIWYGRFERETPLGDVNAKWWAEMAVEQDASECRDRGEATYQRIIADETLDRRSNVARFKIGEVFIPCLEASRPVKLYQTWKVTTLGGLLTLRPVYLETILE